MHTRNLASHLLGLIVVFALLGGPPAQSFSLSPLRLLDGLPARLDSWFRTGMQVSKSPRPVPAKCGITIDPNGCPPPPSCSGCGG